MALIVGKIVGLRRRRRYNLSTLHAKTSLASWRNLVFILRTRCGNDGAAGRQTKNQSSVRRDANKPSAHRTARKSRLSVNGDVGSAGPSRWRSDTFAGRTRL